MSLKPFFTYYGGKWRIAPRYPSPRHDMVIEPFAGSAGYALRHYQKKIVLIDKDPIIAGLWAWLIRASSSEILSLPIEVDDVRSLSVIEEARWLIGFWLNKGTTRPSLTPSAWMRSGVHFGQFWGKRVRERIARQVDHIRHWRVFCASYEEIPNGEATWFIDPPYFKAGIHYRHSEIDFDRLGEWCKERKGQVIACEQEGAAWLPFVPFVNAKAMEGKNGRKRSAEAIWTNNLDLFAPGGIFAASEENRSTPLDSSKPRS